MSDSKLKLFAAALPARTWGEFVSQNIDPVIGLGPDGYPVIPYCGAIPWSPFDRKIKANLASHGQPAREVAYDDDTNKWSIVSNNPPAGSTHGYDHNSANPFNGEHYMVQYGVGGGFWRKRSGVWEQKKVVNLGEAIAVGSCWWGGKFDGAGAEGCWMVMNGAFGDLYCYDPVADKIIYTGSGMQPGAKNGVYHNVMEYSARKNCAVYGGGQTYSQGNNLKLFRLDSDHSIHPMPDAPHDLGINIGMQFVEEPATGNFLAVGFGEVWELNPDDAGKWTKIGPLPADLQIPPATGTQGQQSAIVAISTYGVVAVIDTIRLRTPVAKMRIYKHAPSAAVEPPIVPPGARLQTVTLRSETTGLLPFSFGLAFAEGDCIMPALDLAEYQLTVKRRWNDGSAKHAIVAGQAALLAGKPFTVDVLESGIAPTGKVLTAADIAAAAPQASVQCGTIGKATLDAAPWRMWISGPEMVECHYRVTLGPLCVWFYVRLFKGGRVWIRAIVENGYLQGTGSSSVAYVPVVTIGGAAVPAVTLANHPGCTRWTCEAWIGGDPKITPQHDTAYMQRAKFAPNYMAKKPSEAMLSGLVQDYTPLGPAGQSPGMGMGGYQNGIGLLPLWDAAFFTSGGDPRAYRAVLASSSGLNSFPVIWRDPVTFTVPKPSDHPTYVIFGGTFAIGTPDNPNVWDMNHEPSAGYLAYLLTGDYWHYETALFHCAVDNFCMNATHGTGVNRLLWSAERGLAWNWRNFAQILAVAPDGDPVADDYRLVLANNLKHYRGVLDKGGAGLGYLFAYNLDAYAVGSGSIAPWMNHFLIATLGMGSDLQPLSDMSDWNAVRDSYYRAAVGICGDASGYCFNFLTKYNIRISDGNSLDPKSWYQDWKTVYEKSVGAQPCGNTIKRPIDAGGWLDLPVAEANFNYVGVFLPALAYAVDHGAPGAAAAWARLTGASNWKASVEDGGGWENIPIWGIVPRDVVIPSPPPVVTTETRTVPCPSGQTGSITQRRTITDGVAGPWVETGNTCAATPPPPVVDDVTKLLTNLDAVLAGLGAQISIVQKQVTGSEKIVLNGLGAQIAITRMQVSSLLKAHIK